MARLPPDASTHKHDRSVWKGLVVPADELMPPRPSRAKWWLLGLAIVLAGAVAFTIYRVG